MSTISNKKFDFSPEKRELLQRLLKREGIQVPATRPDVEHREAATHPLSFVQQRLWFLHQLEPTSSNYHMLNPLRLLGKLDIDILTTSLNAIIQRHEVLRTTFPVIDGTPVQRIETAYHPLSLSPIDLRPFKQEDREKEMFRLIREDKTRPFDLARGPLFRAYLLCMNDEEHILLLSMHHIIADAWSMGIIAQELCTIYDALIEGHPLPLPPLNVQYTDFARWHRENIQGEALEQHLQYWVRQLSGAPLQLSLPTDQPRQAKQQYRGNTRSFTLPPDLSKKITELCQREGVTLVMLMIAAFQVLLCRYSNQEDISVGMPVANRSRVEFESLIGNFVNTIVMRTNLSGNPTFREVLKRVREHALDTYNHQDAPFEQVVEAIHPPRDGSRTVLFQVLFALQNAAREQTTKGLSCQFMDIEGKVSYGE